MATQTTGLVWGAILPHGPDVVLELTKTPALMAGTRAAMEAAAQRFAAAQVDTLILLDPWLAHSQNKFDKRLLFRGEPSITVGTVPMASGESYVKGAPPGALVQYACDRDLARQLTAAGRAAGFPVREPELQNGDVPLAWGALIPLWFLLHPLPEARPQLVVIAPSPAVPRAELMRFGELLAHTAAAAGKRVALVASADHGHTHDTNHPRFKYSPASAEYDTLYCNAVKSNHLAPLHTVSDQLLIDSWSDSLWTTLVLAGALQTAPLPVDFLSYEIPSYYGMCVAVYESRD